MRLVNIKQIDQPTLIEMQIYVQIHVFIINNLARVYEIESGDDYLLIYHL